MNATWIEYLAAGLFLLAVLHTFSTSFFEGLSYRFPTHAGLFHLLGEVEAVFGFWAMILVVVMAIFLSGSESIHYLESRNYTEPLFVFAIMVVAASKPVLEAASGLVRLISTGVSQVFRLPISIVHFFMLLSVVPLLGSLITEPAAMTLAALLLGQQLFAQTTDVKFKYATLGVLFVNVSVGGALTSFAAPPILMVANAWGWDTADVFGLFGMKALAVVLINALLLTIWAYKKIPPIQSVQQERMPVTVQAVHFAFLAGIVVFAHHPVVFLSLLLFFMGYVYAYDTYQSPLMLKEALLVSFFLAGLVVLGGLQSWWLQPLLETIEPAWVYFGATALTAMTDNAALTYLGSLVQGTSADFKYALVAGAITGGGLTVIANAPNPAGLSILRAYFPKQSVSALYLFLGALWPTTTAIVVFQLIR